MESSLQFVGIDALNAWAKDNTQYLNNGEIKVGDYDLTRFEDVKKNRFSGLEISGISEVVLIIDVLPYIKMDVFQYYYVNNCYPALQIGDDIITPHGHYNDKTFSFSLLEEIRHDYVHNLSKYDQEDWPKPPKKVGKATHKSLQAWLDYLHEIERLKQQIIDEKMQKVNAFLASLQPYEPSIKWYNDRRQGRIERGGLLYEFSIDNTGYISQKWGKHYLSGNGLEAFMAASDNKLL